MLPIRRHTNKPKKLLEAKLETKITRLKESVKAEMDSAKVVLESWDKNAKKIVRTVKNELR